MAKIFISHSTKNKELVDVFLEFLQLGMGVERSDIFCTAFPEDLSTGEAFMEKIRYELQDCEAVISIITEEYLRSKFCLIELGAAWGMSKNYFPLTLVPFKELKDTPLSGLQMRKLDDIDGISTVYDELMECGISRKRQTAEFTKRLPEFIQTIQELIKGDYIIPQNAEGYYETTVSQIRRVKENYRCYGIKGRIEKPLDNELADSDWIFFWRGMYPDLQIGDKIRFWVSKTEVKEFPDIGRVRNVYPSKLEKVKEQ